jgi:cytochrome c oxidase subunit 2
MIESLVPSASTYAGKIDFVFDLVFWLTLVWSIACFAVFFYCIFKFRAKPGVKAQYIAGETPEEKRFVSIPHMLVLVCDVAVIYFAVSTWYHVKQDMPEPDRTVRVIAQQWAWTFIHPGPNEKLDTPIGATQLTATDCADGDGCGTGTCLSGVEGPYCVDDVVTTEDLHIEVGKNYKYELVSRDVMHDFSIPVFRLKQDAIPGRVITGWFNAMPAENPAVQAARDKKAANQTLTAAQEIAASRQLNEFDLQCAEMCGIGHGIMSAKVVLETPQQHTAWLDSLGTNSKSTTASLK